MPPARIETAQLKNFIAYPTWPAGANFTINFALKAGISFNHLGFLSIDEGYFKQDQFIATKRWNGDEQKVSLPGQHLSVLEVKLYRI